ncbi:hypothetical protein [Arcticibacter sp.]
MEELKKYWSLALEKYRSAETELQLSEAISNIKGLMMLSREMEEPTHV